MATMTVSSSEVRRAERSVGGRQPRGRAADTRAHSERTYADRGPGGFERTYGGREPLRLTRRGRVVIVVVLALVATGVAGLLHGAPTQASDRPTDVTPRASVVVHPGETLWQIARRVAPQTDPRVTVHRIEELNNLTSAAVPAGERLYVPSR
ncbi:MAG TPA: LysM peptidoglycan-binding domain-containing protein [Actinomycetes bacterium]|nr:LysM peptidoglycan-binding domain-containing protein [Actinomycetes bacterium]